MHVLTSKTSYGIVQCQTNAPHSQTANSELPPSQAHMQSAPTLIGQPAPGFAAPPVSPPAGNALHKNAQAPSGLRLERASHTSFTHVQRPFHKHSVFCQAIISRKLGESEAFLQQGSRSRPMRGLTPATALHLATMALVEAHMLALTSTARRVAPPLCRAVAAH